eukprot:m.404685 g.404685  ORF g.404685 m.404685 type:complete len:91 (+) comp21200_c0_seq1:338-610(+)
MSYYRTGDLRREEEGPAIASIYPIVHTEYLLLSRDLGDKDGDGGYLRTPPGVVTRANCIPVMVPAFLVQTRMEYNEKTWILQTLSRVECT